MNDAIPFWVILKMVYSFSLLLTLTMQIGFWSLYEIGYLLNDRQDPPATARVPPAVLSRLNMALFIFLRAALLLCVCGLLIYRRGFIAGAEYLVLSAAILIVLVLHSSSSIGRLPFGKLITFSTLAVYKYLPLLVPALGWHRALDLITALFLCFGLPRILVYFFRKSSPAVAGEKFAENHVRVHFWCLVLAAPLILSHARVAGQPALDGPKAVWLLYMGVCTLLLAARGVRRRGKVAFGNSCAWTFSR